MSIKQRTKSLKRRDSDLANTFVQLEVLNGKRGHAIDGIPRFADAIKPHGFDTLQPTGIDIFQLNIGKMCNQTCAHCHVDAGPDRKEMMTRKDLERCLEIIAEHKIPTLDITGGAPEMHPEFRWFVSEAYKLGTQVIDRCNLTIIMANPKYRDLPDFLAAHKVNVVSSLPYFSAARTDKQRGDGVFEDSIAALKLLNDVGYGQDGSDLQLDLVYNPAGAFLPGDQASLQADFKKQLKRRYDIVFNNLFAITNMPISRFLDYLIESDNYTDYMQSLLDAFNPTTIAGVMCRNTISVSYDGRLYDCDFNQMLELPVSTPSPQHIDTFDFDALMQRRIVLNQHCYGCTAGAGSSCGGETT